MNIFEQLQHFLFKKLPFLNEQEEPDVSSIDYVMNEPKREKIASQSLNLHKNEGYHNILAVLKKASKAEIDYWGNWYEHAHNHVKQLAQKWDIPVEACAGVCAVLSPNLGWKMNLMAADRTISNWKRMNGDETAQHYDKIPAYKTNVNKAYSILSTGDLSVVNGPKVTVFFQSLANPKQLQRDLVLDGHAINVWRGQKAALKNLKGLTKRERVAVIQDYKKVADIVGLTPQQVQAITWFIWKYVSDAPPPPKGKVRVQKPAQKAKEVEGGVTYEGKEMRAMKQIVEALVQDEFRKLLTKK
jgi:hypothetical protein